MKSEVAGDGEATGLLGHLRVLDWTSSAAAYCARLFADLGAEVIRVEAPPAAGDSPDDAAVLPRPQSTFFRDLYANANKSVVVLDLERASDRKRFKALAAASDLILEDQPVGLPARLGLAHADLAGEHPGLVTTSISGFGQSGPWCRYRSNDLVASALGGAMVSIGDPADPPVRMAGHQADITTATLAAASSLVALWSRGRSGRGQHVDISSLEAVAAATHICGVGKWLEDDIIPRRIGTGLVAAIPSGAYRCEDGLAYLIVNRPAHWEALAAWIHEKTGNEEVLSEAFRGPSSVRLPYRELLDVFIGDLMRLMTVEEAYHEAQRRHIAVTPVQTATMVARDRHLLERDFFVDYALSTGDPTGSGSSLRGPGAPYRPSRTPVRRERRAPRRLSDQEESIIRSGRGRDVAKAESLPAGGALDGLRIVEFGTGLAAPWIGRMLAWAGAEVIKIESHAFPDVPRLFVSPREPELGTQPQCSPWFTDWSAGKRFVALDLRVAEGAELARRIVDRSDGVIANYSTGVLEKLGLGFEILSRRNPRLVMLESSGYGGSGPFARYVTWGPNIEALSGLASLSGFPERECTISHFAYPDPLSALHGLFVLMAGLLHRDRDDAQAGQRILLSQFETMVAAIGPLMLESAATGGEPARIGNREPGRAPWGCFPCRGEDRWCVLAIESDDDWNRLRRVMGSPEWASDERFATMASRLDHVDELESRIARWTAGRSDYEVMESCQRAGVAAGVVQNAEDLLCHDPQLASRGFFEEIPHFRKGRVIASGIPLGLTGTPGRTTHAGSAIGQDNEAVLREILGLSEAELTRFVELGAVERAREDPRNGTG